METLLLFIYKTTEKIKKIFTFAGEFNLLNV